MLKRVLKAFASKSAQVRTSTERDAAHAAEAVAFLGPSIGSMPPIGSPEAANDDPMAPVYLEAEPELRRAGYLR